MNSIWNKNYSAFKNRFPALADMMGNPGNLTGPEGLVGEWQVSQAKNGQFTVTENNLRLHSAYNPEREAAGAVNQQDVSKKSATVFYGFGLGYHLVQWAKLYGSTKKLVVIEPDLNHFFAAMTLIDWTEVFTVQSLILAVGCPAESVLQLIENSETVNIGNTGVSDAFYFDIPAFTNHAQPYFDTVKALIKRNQRKNEINAATLKKFGKLWCRNSIKNLPMLMEKNGILQFQNKVPAEMPFLILGAGPSLENVLPYLSEIKQKCVIVCVETALKAMLRSGVQPDFIILTDPQYWAYRHIAGLKAPESILITEISTYSPVFRFDCKEILLCSSQFPVGQYFEQQMDLHKGDLGTGGSVASSAWNFAYLCGAKEIYTAGLDFAFPGKQTHIKGSSAEQTYHTVSNRLAASDKFTASALYSANAVMSKNYKGEPVLTDSRMKMFSWWFEARLANCQDSVTYTLGPEGLCTPGIKIAELNQLLSKENITDKKVDFLKVEPCKNQHKKEFEQLVSQFPSEEFLQNYPFLKEFL